MDYPIPQVAYLESRNPVEQNENALSLLESSINRGIQQISVSRLAVCMCLAAIHDDALYKLANYRSFQQYMNSGRVHIPKSTASEYVKIGRTFIKYRDELSAVNFNEDGGIKKLLLLDLALEHAEKSDVFAHLEDLSFREFKSRFVEAGGRVADAKAKDIQVRYDDTDHSVLIEIDDKNELRILQLNHDVESFCGKAIYTQLYKEIVKTVTGFFG